MVRMIKVHILNRNGMEIKEVNLQEAERYLKRLTLMPWENLYVTKEQEKSYVN